MRLTSKKCTINACTNDYKWYAGRKNVNISVLITNRENLNLIILLWALSRCVVCIRQVKRSCLLIKEGKTPWKIPFNNHFFHPIIVPKSVCQTREYEKWFHGWNFCANFVKTFPIILAVYILMEINFE